MTIRLKSDVELFPITRKSPSDIWRFNVVYVFRISHAHAGPHLWYHFGSWTENSPKLLAHSDRDYSGLFVVVPQWLLLSKPELYNCCREAIAANL